MLYTVYILQLANQTYYVGFTSNLEQRLLTHKAGKVCHTSKHLPFELVFTQSFPTKQTAMKVEKWLKSQKSRKFLERVITDEKIFKHF